MPENVKVVVTLGDPAGVGPEVIVKALASLSASERAHFVVVGNVEALERADRAATTGLSFSDHAGTGAVRVVEVDIGAPLPPIGKVSPVAGEAAVRYIERAVDMAMSGAANVIVTAPINKEAMNLAGHHYDGHAGLLARITGQKSAFMLLASERINVIHVSTHVSLRTAIDRVTTERVLATIEMDHRHFLRMGQRVRIAVAGINLHCGENGCSAPKMPNSSSLPSSRRRPGASMWSGRFRLIRSLPAPIMVPST